VKKKTIVLIPAFNEESSIGDVIRTTLLHRGIRCVVVDDGSTDHTALVARRAGAVVLRTQQNKGTGSAVRAGLFRAIKNNADAVVLMDADGQHDPRYVGALVSELSSPVDMVIGSRYISPTPNSTSFIRRAGTKLISLMFLFFLKKKIYDPTSGFRAMNKKTLLFLADRYPGVFPEPETIIRLIHNGFVIKEVPIGMKPRAHGSSSIRFCRAIFLTGYLAMILLSETTKRRHCYSGSPRRGSIETAVGVTARTPEINCRGKKMTPNN
jgi:glycosyltransferase involved in cell wall biosynthesis